MKTQGKTLAQEAFFRCRIYSIFLAVAFCCLPLIGLYPQEINSYKSISSGNYDNPLIWNVYDGAFWLVATAKPTQLNDIYIDQNHLLTLSGNEEAKSVFINAQSGAGQKLNLGGRNLDIYGTLQAFDGPAPGIPSGSWNSQNWIGNSITSTLTFKGNSRIIIPKNAWSGFTTQSRYSVIFDPGVGNTLTIEEPFKAVRFIVRSGAVLQKLDISVMPNFCASLSFNTETTFYPAGPFGDFIIESGAKFISECNNNIIARSISGTVSANFFHLQIGGELILEGTNPRIEAANFQLDGKVTFSGGSAIKSILTSTFIDAGTISSFHNMEIQGIRDVQFPAEITITGSLTKTGSASFITSTSHITFAGTHDQTISGFSLAPQDLTVNKASGTVSLAQNLTILRNLTMLSGRLDFHDNQLTINSSGTGTYNYSDGSWENLTTLTFVNTPTNLTASNATFPFGDRYHGGIRKVQMVGNNAGGNLTIDYTEYKGADFNPGFDDTGSIPILYRLFSYFNFSGLNSSSNPLELRISADNLIVDEPEDLRLVCTGYAAPGNHIESLDDVNLWAIRELTFDDLPGKNFTVGSFRTLSILPVTWLSLTAEAIDNVKQINWSVAQENNNEKFEIYLSSDGLKDWTKMGEVTSKGDSDEPAFYTFIDENLSKSISSYYQIKVIDFSGEFAWSKIVRLITDQTTLKEQISIHPNPHTSGKIKVSLPEVFTSENTQVTIYSVHGVLILSFSFNEAQFTEKLEALNPGLYLITFSNNETQLHTRWIKR